jgi:uncharacterized membrane protein YphA (DoxX/SURF4 family)
MLGSLGTVFTFAFWMSMRNRFPELWDGGDNLMELVFYYAMFAQLRKTALAEASRPTRARQVLHNIAILSIALQVSVVYVVAGVTKLHGQTWWNGTALYYALVDGEFYFPGVTDRLTESAVLVALLSYATVAFQVSFPFLLCINRFTRLAAIGIGIVFHLSIVVVLGLTSFGFFMIAAELSLVSDDEYIAIARTLTCMRELFAKRVLQVREATAKSRLGGT